MTGYGVVPKLLCLQTKIWNHQAKMVCCVGGTLGKLFEAFQSVTQQGGHLSSLMFNVYVDTVMREWLRQTLEEEAALGRFKQASRDKLAFFVDNRLVGSRNPGCRVPSTFS